MELKQYGAILARRWWVIAALVVLAALSALALRPQVQQSYQAGTKLAVKPRAQMAVTSYFSSEYYDYLSAEFLLDDLVSTLQSNQFIGDVQTRLKERAGGPPAGGVSAKKIHRVLEVTATGATAQDALDIAKATGDMLSEPGNPYIGSLTSADMVVSIVQPPVIVGAPGETRTVTDMGLRVVLALLAGIGLAFLLDYLDDSIRGAEDLERRTGLRVLAEIPRQKGN